ncbi:MAG: undecaprenyl-diphosphate phosphatase, partial [Egibacteraceae bacterium]
GFVVLASVPVAAAGLFLEELVGRAVASPAATSGFLLVTAGLLLGGERLRTRRIVGPGGQSAPPVPPGSEAADTETEVGARVGLPTGADPTDPDGSTLANLTLRQALVVGGMQTLALLPGISRSGSTIAAGMGAGLTREAATRFSFLLSLPALLGAFVLSVGDLAEPGPYPGVAIAAAVVAAFVSGYVAIRFLVALVARDRLTGFAIYCVAAAVVGFAAVALRG